MIARKAFFTLSLLGEREPLVRFLDDELLGNDPFG